MCALSHTLHIPTKISCTHWTEWKKKNNRFFWCGSVVPQFDVNKMAMNENIKPKLYCMCYNEFHYMHVRVINKVLYLIAPKLNEQRQTLTTFLYVCFHWEFFQYVSISIRCLYPSNIHAFKIARKVLIRKKKIEVIEWLVHAKIVIVTFQMNIFGFQFESVID